MPGFKLSVGIIAAAFASMALVGTVQAQQNTPDAKRDVLCIALSP